MFSEAGNALSSCLLPMTVETQMTLALLQELLMALRANDADGYKSWLALGIENLEGMWLLRSSPSGWCPYWLKKRGTSLWHGSWV